MNETKDAEDISAKHHQWVVDPVKPAMVSDKPGMAEWAEQSSKWSFEISLPSQYKILVTTRAFHYVPRSVLVKQVA